MSTTELATKNKENALEKSAEKNKIHWLRPHYEWTNDKEAFYVTVYIPGVSKNNTSINLEKDTLQIEGIRTSHKDVTWKTVQNEIPNANYRLNLQLNVPVNENKIQANVEHGVLNITLPIAETAKPRSIKIQ